MAGGGQEPEKALTLFADVSCPMPQGVPLPQRGDGGLFGTACDGERYGRLTGARYDGGAAKAYPTRSPASP